MLVQAMGKMDSIMRCMMAVVVRKMGQETGIMCCVMIMVVQEIPDLHDVDGGAGNFVLHEEDCGKIKWD